MNKSITLAEIAIFLVIFFTIDAIYVAILANKDSVDKNSMERNVYGIFCYWLFATMLMGYVFLWK